MEAVKRLYEGMFLIDSAEAAKDWDGIMDLITKILTRHEAEIVSIRKWDERALAYPIHRCTRGTYILAYFRVNGQKVSDIERDARLSERIMRALILKAEHLTEEDIAKETPATRGEKQASPDKSPAAQPAAVTKEVAPPVGEVPQAIAEEIGLQET